MDDVAVGLYLVVAAAAERKAILETSDELKSSSPVTMLVGTLEDRVAVVFLSLSVKIVCKARVGDEALDDAALASAVVLLLE